MSSPFVAVSVCPGSPPSSVCSDPITASGNGPQFEFVGNLTASVWVAAAPPAGNPASCGNADPGSLVFTPVNNLGVDTCLFALTADGSLTGFVPSSTFTFGSAAFSPPFDVSQLDLVQFGQVFAAGFLLVGMFWALGQAVGAIMKVVRR